MRRWSWTAFRHAPSAHRVPRPGYCGTFAASRRSYWPPSRPAAGERVLEMTVEYSLDRVQFGRPIGSFQAIKHKCAELLVRLRCARAAVDYAAKVADVRPDALELAAALAGSSATNAFLTTCLDSIQIHGGVGFTWEHRAHLYLRRALSSERLLGDPARHAETLGRLLGV